ncbi:hypothetical protein QQP08_025159 [Theobroma cacao]|nr:hypothetical protein QQP08_025159 [Theobroma cacao]
MGYDTWLAVDWFCVVCQLSCTPPVALHPMTMSVDCGVVQLTKSQAQLATCHNPTTFPPHFKADMALSVLFVPIQCLHYRKPNKVDTALVTYQQTSPGTL